MEAAAVEAGRGGGAVLEVDVLEVMVRVLVVTSVVCCRDVMVRAIRAMQICFSSKKLDVS